MSQGLIRNNQLQEAFEMDLSKRKDKRITYACEVCGKLFKAENGRQFLLTAGIYPVCNEKHNKAILTTLENKGNSELKIIYKEFFPEESLPTSRKEGIFKITKKIIGGKK